MIKDAYFLFLQYLDIHPFLIPLGIVGLWRWSVWTFKEIVARNYKPATHALKANVSIVTPVYNEDPHVFKKALLSWKNNKPAEIIAIIDYTDKKCIQVFRDFAKKDKNTHLIITKTPGKRPALARGIGKAKHDIVALIDSDTIWDKNVIKNALPPFHDKKVAGVSTYQNVLEPKTLAQRLFDVHLDLRYRDDFAFLAAAGNALICLSGRTAFYRRKIILPMLPDLLNETFMGTPVISGDDKRLTYLVLAAGWKVSYQSNSHVYTPGMVDFGSYLQQRIRWSRNSLRSDLRALWEGWPFKHKALVFFQIDKVVQAFAVILSPIYFFISLLMGLWIPAAIIFAWWFVSRTIKMYPHLRRRPQDSIVIPVFVFYSFLTAIIKIYAFFTLNTQGWITRWDKARLPQLRFMQHAPAYAATFVFLLLLTGGVFLNRQFNYVIPRENQQKLIAQTLPTTQKSPPTQTAVHYADLETKQKGLLVKKHVVQQGESLGSVAQQYGISIDNLLLANVSRLTNWNTIEPGFILTVPGKDTALTNSNTFNYQRIYPDITQAVYEPSTNTIIVTGRGTKVTLASIQASVGEEYLKQVKEKEWYLKANIFIRSGVTLDIDKSEVTWLKLASNKTTSVYLRASSGVITLNGVKVTSWDETTQDYDKDITDKRSYILVKDNSRLDIYDSELAYLGFSRELDLETSPYGVSWRMSNGKIGTTVLTGEVINSKFHHNYFGAYTFGATGMTWKGNKFYDNTRYGLDPHDDSNGFLIENNTAYNNGTHGIILSKRCVNNIIRNNTSYNNKLHGIMLHEKSNENIVVNNIVYGNTDGITLWHSSNNLIHKNMITNNKNGFRANEASNNNVVTYNTITGTKQFGVYLYQEANNNMIMHNTIGRNNIAVYIKTANNQVTNNMIEDSNTGIYLLGDAKDNFLSNNTIRYSHDIAIYTKINPHAKNLLGNNTFWRNRKDIRATETTPKLSAKN